MSLSFAFPWALALLLGIPFIWRYKRYTLTRHARRHLKVLAIVRTIVILLATLAMAQPTVSYNSRSVSVVYALDISQSVPANFIQEAIGWITEAEKTKGVASSKVVVFGDKSVHFDKSDEVGGLELGIGASGKASLERSDTNLENALREALSVIEGDRVKRLVLFSDGNETIGDIRSVIPALQESNVRVFPIAPMSGSLADIWVDRIDAPERVRSGQFFNVDVRVFSGGKASAKLIVTFGEESVQEKSVTLAPGLNSFEFEGFLGKPGSMILKAKLESKEDTFESNNEIRRSIWVDDKPSVLYVEGSDGDPGYFQRALEDGGMNVDLKGIEFLPTELTTLRSYQAIVLSDLASSQMTDQQMNTVVSYVRDFGGGLVFAGGGNTFGEGGYSGSILEKALPIEFKAREKRKDLALVIAIDRSFSMKGRKMEYAKEAARAALDLLEEQHLFGVVAFDSQPYIPVPVRMVRSKRRAEDRISRIKASGQTNIYPALGVVYRMLEKEQSRAKHVILLSDGDTHPADFQRLLGRMIKAGIVISTVTIGKGGDPELMSNIAKWGNGRAYLALSANDIPQLFVEETQKAVGSSLEEEDVQVISDRSVEAFKGIEFEDAPFLRGRIETKQRDTAEVLLRSQDDSPLLSKWQYGLGKVVVFSSDVTNRWSSNWIGWKDYGKFWSQVVRDTMKMEIADLSRMNFQRNGQEIIANLIMMDDDGKFQNKLAPKLKVVNDNNEVKIEVLKQVAPGSYRAVLSFGDSEQLSFAVVPDGGVSIEKATELGEKTLYKGYSKEYRMLPSNLELLKVLADSTGGSFPNDASDIFNTNDEIGKSKNNISAFLALMALVFFLFDIFLRRSPVVWNMLGEKK